MNPTEKQLTNHATAEYQRELATQLAYDRRHPEQRWHRDDEDTWSLIRAANQGDPAPAEHCNACGYDLGTHHPTCTEVTNPNRPTGETYCANCGFTPCRLTDVPGYTCTELHQPEPITPFTHETHLACDRIDSLTDSERRDALVYLTGATPDTTDRAIAHVISQRR